MCVWGSSSQNFHASLPFHVWIIIICDVLQRNGRHPVSWKLSRKRSTLHTGSVRRLSSIAPTLASGSRQSRTTNLSVKCNDSDWWYGDVFKPACTCRLCSYFFSGLSQGKITKRCERIPATWCVRVCSSCHVSTAWYRTVILYDIERPVTWTRSTSMALLPVGTTHLWFNVNGSFGKLIEISEISGSRGGDYEDDLSEMCRVIS
jgi:hypothetical protein